MKSEMEENNNLNKMKLSGDKIFKESVVVKLEICNLLYDNLLNSYFLY